MKKVLMFSVATIMVLTVLFSAGATPAFAADATTEDECDDMGGHWNPHKGCVYRQKDSYKFGGGDSSATVPVHASYGAFVSFDEGACDGVCKTDFWLPVRAYKRIGEIPLTLVNYFDERVTLYVMMKDANGDPGTGSYAACFSGRNPWKTYKIYRWVHNSWDLVPSWQVDDTVCTSASGDGAFVLVKN